ncbi:MAG: hypothetical protein H7263_15010 [Candidatus Sericytochromatia bacterium]|nr:hypothetical protein [Candidatus Sericytochromatia bacterium]
MAQEYKWKFFYNSDNHNIDEIITFAEEQSIKGSYSDNSKGKLSGLISQIEDNLGYSPVFFEDKGMIYGLSGNFYLNSKLSKEQ